MPALTRMFLNATTPSFMKAFKGAKKIEMTTRNSWLAYEEFLSDKREFTIICKYQ